MGKLKDLYLNVDTAPVNIAELPEYTFIKVTKYGSLDFYYFKEEGMWYQPGITRAYDDNEINIYMEQVEVLYMPENVAIIEDFEPIGECLSCGYTRCACDSFFEAWRER